MCTRGLPSTISPEILSASRAEIFRRNTQQTRRKRFTLSRVFHAVQAAWNACKTSKDPSSSLHIFIWSTPYAPSFPPFYPFISLSLCYLPVPAPSLPSHLRYLPRHLSYPACLDIPFCSLWFFLQELVHVAIKSWSVCEFFVGLYGELRNYWRRFVRFNCFVWYCVFVQSTDLRMWNLGIQIAFILV